ncbi:unnamed protein product [Rotaria magnacalcarata]|uniref:Uncharacterized protein n=1 Tax=Rotaria magnacalcarata TaxID=392030 RepID=A0A820FXB0_9BILA|nr:unnamed protein product [Rotaria magnacalcarata]CAF4268375.1 unnamed protein product [Rotaria magnacalcarata]
MLKKSFPDKPPSRLHQLVKEADKDGMNKVLLENFMVVVDFFLNEEKQPNEDDEFPDDEETDQRYKDFAYKISDLADNDQTLTPAMLKQMLKDFKIEKLED